MSDCFAKVEKIELEYDQDTKKFNGTAKIEFVSEFDAKQAFSQMMGLKVGDKYLFVKKMQPPTEEEIMARQKELGIEIGAHEEVFRQIIEDKPTKCLVMKNLVSL